MSTDGVHVSVKAIQDMEAACARFSRAVVDRLPEIERELRQVTEELDDRRSQLRREIADLEEEISSADEDDDKSRERQRAGEAEDELASVGRNIRRLAEVGANYTGHAHNVERLATAHAVGMREFLGGAADDLKAYFAKNDLGAFIPFGSTIGSSSANGGDTVASSENEPGGNYRPDLEAIANNPVVRVAIAAAWDESSPHIVGKKRETGFWIIRDDQTGEFSSIQFSRDEATNRSIAPGIKPMIPGKTTVALFHTHPNTIEEGFTQGPSKSDIQFVNDPAINVPGILRAHDRIHYFGPELPPHQPSRETHDDRELSVNVPDCTIKSDE